MRKNIFVCVFQIPFFDDVGAVTLQYFDSLFQRDNLQKSQFYKGLPKVLPKLPKVNAANKSPQRLVCSVNTGDFTFIFRICINTLVYS